MPETPPGLGTMIAAATAGAAIYTAFIRGAALLTRRKLNGFQAIHDAQKNLLEERSAEASRLRTRVEYLEEVLREEREESNQEIRRLQDLLRGTPHGLGERRRWPRPPTGGGPEKS